MHFKIIHNDFDIIKAKHEESWIIIDHPVLAGWNDKHVRVREAHEKFVFV